MMQSKLSVGMVGLAFALLCGLLVGCGTTVEKQQARFKKNTDTMEALAAKNPMMRAPVNTKMAAFKKEHDEIVAAGGENAPRDLARLNGRIEEYVRKLDPSLAPKKTTTTTGKKLGNGPATGTAPALGSKLGGSGTTAAPGGKLGGTAAPGTAPAGKLGGTAAPGTAPGGKLGGTAAPGTAPAGKLGTAAPGTAPGGKLGGTAAPGTAPGGKLGGTAAPGTAPAGKLGGQ